MRGRKVCGTEEKGIFWVAARGPRSGKRNETRPRGWGFLKKGGGGGGLWWWFGGG